MTTKRFPVRVLLSVTTELLLTKPRGDRDNGIGDLYEILGWMTNDSPFTHQLPRFNEECKPWLLRWFPELAAANDHLDALQGLIRVHGSHGVDQWVAKLGLPAEYDVPRIPADDHEQKHPYDELVAMRGTDEGVIVFKPE